jgi:hypothetical protein
MDEEGTPYFPVKHLVAPYLTKSGGNVRLRQKDLTRVNAYGPGAGTLL